ncbi:MAG TPA: inorganic phosphate transporter [Actinomycetota bacterium]|nr:inorganic phosphate transporter [Actinomycetota bacterium]
MDLALLAIIALVAVALLFDFTNGFHDAANSVGTVVATRALPAKWAPAFSAFFNFLALFVVGTAVASTVGKTVKEGFASEAVIFAALFAAVAWNYITWFIGMPSSSSHAIIGGLVGAGLAAGGVDAITWSAVQKAAIGIVASPLVAFTIAFILMYVVYLIQKMFKLHDDHPTFKGLQLVSAAALSFGHGANDAQKTMGVIGALLLGAGYTTMDDTGKHIVLPMWVELSAYSAIALGTLWGGWKIIETVGLRITTLHANSGAAANLGASTAIFGATAMGVPISTTHAAASSVVGAGVSSGKGANWRVVGEMMIAWVVTIPLAASIAFAMYWLTQLPTVLAWVVVGPVVIAFGTWVVWAMRHSVHASDIDKDIPSDKDLDEFDQDPMPHLKGHGPVD